MRGAKSIQEAENRADIYLNRIDKYFELLKSKPANGTNDKREGEALNYLDEYTNREVFKIENLSHEDQLKVQEYILRKRKILSKKKNRKKISKNS